SPTTTVASVTDARGRSLTVRVRVPALCPLALGGALWALACPSQEAFRGIVERLSPDGRIESLGELWARLPCVGSFILLCGGLLLGFSEPIAAWLRGLPAGLRGPGRLSGSLASMPGFLASTVPHSYFCAPSGSGCGSTSSGNAWAGA